MKADESQDDAYNQDLIDSLTVEDLLIFKEDAQKQKLEWEAGLRRILADNHNRAHRGSEAIDIDLRPERKTFEMLEYIGRKQAWLDRWLCCKSALAKTPTGEQS